MKEDIEGFNRSFFYYLQQSHFVYECRTDSFNYTNKKISKWKSTGVFNYPDDSSIKGIEDTKTTLPELKNDGRMHVYLQGNYFQQNNLVNTNNNKAVIIGVINIYIVYKLDPIAQVEILLLLYKMLYLELCKLLKMLILQNMTIKITAYVLMKEVSLAIQ